MAGGGKWIRLLNSKIEIKKEGTNLFSYVCYIFH